MRKQDAGNPPAYATRERSISDENAIHLTFPFQFAVLNFPLRRDLFGVFLNIKGKIPIHIRALGFVKDAFTFSTYAGSINTKLISEQYQSVLENVGSVRYDSIQISGFSIGYACQSRFINVM